MAGPGSLLVLSVLAIFDRCGRTGRALRSFRWGIETSNGAVAQLGEHLLCKQGVSGSIPLSSTKGFGVEGWRICFLSLGKISLHRLFKRLMPVLLTL